MYQFTTFFLVIFKSQKFFCFRSSCVVLKSRLKCVLLFFIYYYFFNSYICVIMNYCNAILISIINYCFLIFYHMFHYCMYHSCRNVSPTRQEIVDLMEISFISLKII